MDLNTATGSDPHISPTTVELFRIGLEIIAADGDLKWEDEGGRRREFLDLCGDLHALLGRRPWEATVFHIAADLRDGLRPPRDDELSAARQRRALLNALKAGCLFIGIAAAARKAVDS